MKIYVGADHAGFRTAQAIVAQLKHDGHDVTDFGTLTQEKSVDYPDYAALVGKAVSKGRQSLGVLICGTGTGMVIAANKIPGVRAATVYDAYTAKMARHDNDANVIALRGRRFPQKDALRLVRIFVDTPFSNIARHQRRINKIRRLERG